MKSITVNVQIQLDIEDGGNDLSQVVEILSNINDIISTHDSLGNPSIFVDEVSEQHIFDNDLSDDNESQEYSIGYNDVKNVADTLCIGELSNDEIFEVIKLYPSEQRNDPTASWNLVVENIIYNLKQ